MDWFHDIGIFLTSPISPRQVYNSFLVPNWKVLLRNDIIKKCVKILDGIRTFPEINP